MKSFSPIKGPSHCAGQDHYAWTEQPHGAAMEMRWGWHKVDQCGIWGCYPPGGPDRKCFKSLDDRIRHIGREMHAEGPLLEKLEALKDRLQLRYGITYAQGMDILSQWIGSKGNAGKSK